MAPRRPITVLDPSGNILREERSLARRLNDLPGRTVGLIDDGIAYADAFLERIGELLLERDGVETVIPHQKPNLSAPTPKTMIQEIVSQVDFAVVGVGG